MGKRRPPSQRPGRRQGGEGPAHPAGRAPAPPLSERAAILSRLSDSIDALAGDLVDDTRSPSPAHVPRPAPTRDREAPARSAVPEPLDHIETSAFAAPDAPGTIVVQVRGPFGQLDLRLNRDRASLFAVQIAQALERPPR